MDELGFSLYEQIEYNNQTLEISYTPTSSITKYSYQILKDGELYETNQVNGMKTTQFFLHETGEYKIKITLNKRGKEEIIESGFYRIDVEKPIIRLKDTSSEILTIEQPRGNESFNLNDYIIAYDNIDGDLSKNVVNNASTIDFQKLGIHDLVYTVSDQAGNQTELKIHLHLIKNKQASLLSIQIIFLLFVLFVLLWIIRYYKSIKLEKRLSKYSVQGVRNYSTPVFAKIIIVCQNVNKKLSNMLSKLTTIKKYSRHYDKYIPLYTPFYQTGMDAVSTKFISGFIFILIAIFTMALRHHVFSPYELWIPFLFGFFFPNILFFSKYKFYRNTLENDLLQAIIIMNNAFKSGRSISQAIDLVTKELTGPIAEEFKKMSLELSFGLSIEETFKRFSKRIQLEEVNYLTASLSILNRTGGNIIQVFTSIEKSLFNKKRLKLELASLTGSSKMIAYVLFVVPPMFILFIGLINPTYFVPLYTTTLGYILCGIILMIYICYILVVRKIMRVRM